MKLKAIIAGLALFGIGLLLPLSAQETPTNTPFYTNTPTLTTAGVLTPTNVPQTERVIVALPERVTFDGQRFQIVGLELERSAHTLDSVTITVRNLSDAPASGQVWYLLAPPASPEPWNEAVYIAESQPITDLPAQESQAFTFPAPPDDIIAETQLSAWVHQAQPDGTSVHADGFGYDQPVLLAPDVYLTVEHVDQFRLETGETLLFVTLRIRSFNSAPTEVAYSFTLAPPDDPTPWATGVFVLPYQSLLLLPGQDLTLATRTVVTLPDADLQVIGWLQEKVGDELQFRNNDLYP